MSRLFSWMLISTLGLGQQYQISILGFPVADVEQTIHDSGKIEFTTENLGIFDLIWPAKNYYTAEYDTNSFALKSWQKNIKQGEFKQNIAAQLDSTEILVYDKKNKIDVSPSTYTILTLLAMVQSRPAEDLDTKWFNYEQEGQIGRARFLWADTGNVWYKKDSIRCDHYRLDLEITDASRKINDRSDYFLDEIILEKVVREIWVSRNKPKKIIQATLKTAWFPITAKLNE